MLFCGTCSDRKRPGHLTIGLSTADEPVFSLMLAGCSVKGRLAAGSRPNAMKRCRQTCVGTSPFRSRAELARFVS